MHVADARGGRNDVSHRSEIAEITEIRKLELRLPMAKLQFL
jgi:hypothetical protein